MKKIGPRETTSDQVDCIVKYLEDCFQNNRETNSCYIYGMGGQSKSTYIELALIDGVSVRLSHTCLPHWLAFLGFIPSFAGVVQILKPSQLDCILEKLGDSGMVGIYIFSSRRDEEFIKLLKSKPNPKTIEAWLNTVDEGIFYQFDSSNGSSKTGMYDWLMLGDTVSSSIIAEFEKHWEKR